MGAMPEKKREPNYEEFCHNFDELQNDLLNMQQILHEREKSGASFDTIAKELESLKEDAQSRLVDLQQLYNQNQNLFPNNSEQILNQCNKWIQNLHPEYLSQKKWNFNERFLSGFRKNLGM